MVHSGGVDRSELGDLDLTMPEVGSLQGGEMLGAERENSSALLSIYLD